MKKQMKFNEFEISNTYEFVRVALELGYSVNSIKEELNDTCSDFSKKLENLRNKHNYSVAYARKVSINDIYKDITSRGTSQNRYTNAKVNRILEKYVNYNDWSD